MHHVPAGFWTLDTVSHAVPTAPKNRSVLLIYGWGQTMCKIWTAGNWQHLRIWNSSPNHCPLLAGAFRLMNALSLHSNPTTKYYYSHFFHWSNSGRGHFLKVTFRKGQSQNLNPSKVCALTASPQCLHQACGMHTFKEIQCLTAYVIMQI